MGVGSYSDPSEIQGLAHFVEHMVFMGSEKYPKENEFDSFIKVNLYELYCFFLKSLQAKHPKIGPRCVTQCLGCRRMSSNLRFSAS